MKFIHGFAGTVMIVWLFTGCGGGGGGGSGASGFSYDGITSEAQVGESNARDFVDVAVTGSAGSDALTMSAAEPAAGDPVPGLDLVMLAATLADAGVSIDASGSLDDGSGNSGAQTAEVFQDSSTVPGDCGGQFVINISVDDVTGAFNGTISFQGYNDCASTINGDASFSGTINLGTFVVESFTLTTSLLTVSTGGESVDLNGSLTINIVGFAQSEVVYDVDFRTGGEVFRLENFAVLIDASMAPVSITFAGRVYHPDHGFVTISTNSPVRISLSTGIPHSGELLFTGGGGSTATVTFDSISMFTIEVDSDGDTFVDTTLICKWATGDCAA